MILCRKLQILIKINPKVKKLRAKKVRRRSSKKFCNQFNIKTHNYRINKEKTNDRNNQDKISKDTEINNKKLLEITQETIHKLKNEKIIITNNQKQK
jgi:hypothetical protein